MPTSSWFFLFISLLLSIEKGKNRPIVLFSIFCCLFISSLTLLQMNDSDSTPNSNQSFLHFFFCERWKIWTMCRLVDWLRVKLKTNEMKTIHFRFEKWFCLFQWHMHSLISTIRSFSSVFSVFLCVFFDLAFLLRLWSMCDGGWAVFTFLISCFFLVCAKQFRFSIQSIKLIDRIPSLLVFSLFSVRNSPNSANEANSMNKYNWKKIDLRAKYVWFLFFQSSFFCSTVLEKLALQTGSKIQCKITPKL